MNLIGRRGGGKTAAVLVVLASLVAALALTACGGGSSDADKTPTPGAATEPASRPTSSTNPGDIPADVGKDDEASLTGAGATFPAPLYTRWFSDYKSNVAPGVEINYQAIGSGGGVKQIAEQTVDFGASDAPLSDREIDNLPAPLQHIPTTIGAVVVTYNIDGVSQPLKLDGDTMAQIYLGNISKWNDEAIASQNPGVDLPDADIVVVHRSDGSGTSFVFTDYLSSVSPDWKDEVGTSKNPQWPVGLGGQGNDGVTQQVKQNQNSIGYVEVIYAEQNDLPAAELKNQSGNYVAATTESASMAASGIQLPDDYRVSIVNSPSPDAYPIASFTWILLYKEQSDANKGKALVDFLWWAVHDGQQTAPELSYAPLPDDVVKALEQTLLTQITGPDGQPLLTAQ